MGNNQRIEKHYIRLEDSEWIHYGNTMRIAISHDDDYHCFENFAR